MFENIPQGLHTFLNEFKNRLNKDERFRNEAKDWSGTILFTILPDANFPWILRIFISIEKGKVIEMKLISNEEKTRVTFEFKMTYSTFLLIARGNLDVGATSILKGKIKLIGSLIQAVKKMNMFKEIIRVMREIIAEWRGKTAILLRRAEFLSPHIILGTNVRQILAGIKAERALIITDKVMVEIGYAKEIKKWLELNDIRVEIFDGVKPEPPIEVVRQATKYARSFKPDLIIGVGGGSAMDTAKAVFVLYERSDIPLEKVDPGWELGLRRKTRLILIPTTSGTGSEVTWATVITVTKDGVKEKIGVGNREILADYAIIDPYFIYKLPKKLVSSTGLDALTHAVEGILSPWRNEIVNAVAIRAIKLLFKYLPKFFLLSKKLFKIFFN